MASYDNPSSGLDGLGFSPDWPCCLAMKAALDSRKAGFIAMIPGESCGERVLLLSGDGGQTTLCEVEFCPWCGADINLVRHKLIARVS